MSNEYGLHLRFEIEGRDFGQAGVISTQIKEILQELGIAASVIRRTAIASYEAEMNIVMYAHKGMLTLRLNPQVIHLSLEDQGPGIENLELAMQEGFSTATDEIRQMGFGAGMGLPNIKKNADKFEISSTPGEGTSLNIYFYLDKSEKQ